MSFVPGRRPRLAALVLLVVLATLCGVLVDAAARRGARDDARQDAVVALTGLPDLALSSSARWLRHPSQTEPAAAAADLPASLDVDPAGAMIGPPREVLRQGAVELRRSSGSAE